MNVYSSFIPNCQNLEATKMSFSRRMDIQTGGHPRQWNSLQSYEETSYQDFPGGPMIKIPTSNTGDVDLIPGQGTETPCALWPKKKKKKTKTKNHETEAIL